MRRNKEKPYMSMRHMALALLLLGAWQKAGAQQRVVLADMDSRRTLAGASFITDRNERLVADAAGGVQ